MHLSKITDAGLRELSRLEHLELLNVIGTNVTDASVVEFRKALPACSVLALLEMRCAMLTPDAQRILHRNDSRSYWRTA